MMMVDISVNMFLETLIYSHLNKNKVNTKSVTLIPAPYTLRYLTLNVYNFYIINATHSNYDDLFVKCICRDHTNFILLRLHNIAF